MVSESRWLWALLTIAVLQGGFFQPTPVFAVDKFKDDIGPLTPRSSCLVGSRAVDPDCVPDGLPTGRVFVVDGTAPHASDEGPGSSAAPWRTISRSTRAGSLRPGDTIMIRAGTYREEIHPSAGGTGPDTRVTFAAYPGETVVVTGADEVDAGWQRQAGGVWRLPWRWDALPTYSDDPVFRREMLIVNGRVQTYVAEPGELVPGAFTMIGSDTAPSAILAKFPGGASPVDIGSIEVAVRGFLFQPQGSDPSAECGDASTPGWFRLSGITFRHAANRAQWGAICAGSEGSLVENVRVEWTNGMGVDGSGRDHVFRGVRAENNGQMGWGASCDRCLFENNASIGNNWKGYDPFWEAGGGKWYKTTNSIIRGHFAAHNDGPGIWLDGENDSNTIEDCLVVGNQVAGIMLELETTRTLVQNNVVAASRWRDWSGTGILSQAASRNVIVHNTVESNEGTGVWIRFDPLRRAEDGSNEIFSNWIVGNAADRSVEARQISVEGESLANVRSNQVRRNVYGAVRGDPVLRSTFFIAPAGRPDVRTNSIAVWRDALGKDEDSVTSDSRPTLPGRAATVQRAGAPGTAVRTYREVGASSPSVRAFGEWRLAPPRSW